MNGDETQPLFIDLTTPPSNNNEGRIRRGGKRVNVLEEARLRQDSRVNAKNTLSEISVNKNDFKNITIVLLICVILYLLSHK